MLIVVLVLMFLWYFLEDFLNIPYLKNNKNRQIHLTFEKMNIFLSVGFVTKNCFFVNIACNFRWSFLFLFLFLFLETGTLRFNILPLQGENTDMLNKLMAAQEADFTEYRFVIIVFYCRIKSNISENITV